MVNHQTNEEIRLAWREQISYDLKTVRVMMDQCQLREQRHGIVASFLLCFEKVRSLSLLISE